MEEQYVHVLLQYPNEILGVYTVRQKALDEKIRRQTQNPKTEYFITTWLLDWSLPGCC